MATTLNNLALLYDAMGAYEKALPLYERAIKIAQKKLGKDHPNTKTFQKNYWLTKIRSQWDALQSADTTH